MRRPVHLILIAAVTALLTACGAADGGAPADDTAVATVNDEEITAAQLDELTTEASTAGAGDQAAGNDADPLAPQRRALSLLIPDAVITDVAEGADVQVTDENLQVAREQLMASLGGQEQLAQALGQAGLTQAVVDEILIPQQARVLALSQQLARGKTLTTRTVRQITVATEQEAQQVRARLAAGADFTALARQLSTDPSSAQGGVLPATPRGALPQPLDDAVWQTPIGKVGGPVQTEAGWHVFEVTDETSTPGADLGPDQVGQLVGPQLQELVGTALSAADVEVDDTYGTWDATRQSVVPPVADQQAPAPGVQAPTGGILEQEPAN